MTVPNRRKYFPCEGNLPVNIYERMSDDTSKKIYINRCLYSLTNDFSYIRDIIERTEAGKALVAFLDEQGKERPIYIYGAGIKGTRLINIFPDKHWGGFVDKNKRGTHEGYPVFSLDNCKELRMEASIVISVTHNSSQIKSELQSMGIENVFELKQFDGIADQKRYFDEKCIGSIRDIQGIFVDAGAYDGGDTIRYLSICKNENARAMVFEADPRNFEMCKSRLFDEKQVDVYPIGLSDEKGTLHFNAAGSVDSRFSKDGSEEVSVCPLDDYMGKGKIGFIKMDVEGMEEKVLLGAKKIISEMTPTLVLSIYHQREDIWRLPHIILSINPNYHFFLRHYSVGVTDTVLYAVNSITEERISNASECET